MPHESQVDLAPAPICHFARPNVRQVEFLVKSDIYTFLAGFFCPFFRVCQFARFCSIGNYPSNINNLNCLKSVVLAL